MEIRSRIKELVYVKAGELRQDPRNWRRHPQEQQSALVEAMERIGDIDAVIARQTDDGLVLVDGHLRAGLDAERQVAVLVTDLTEEEAAVALATYDPISAMAEFDEPALRALITEIPGAGDLQALASVAELYDLGPLAAEQPQPASGGENGGSGGENGGSGAGTAATTTGITKPVIIDVPEERYSEFVAQLNELADRHQVDTWYAALQRVLATE